MALRTVSSALCVTFIASALYLLLHHVTNSINNAIRKPYMDEIFHIPQAQRYCIGNYSHYDPKLTTPPGLYLFSLAQIWVRDKLLNRRPNLLCDTLDLRQTNHLIAILNFVTILLIQLSTSSFSGHLASNKLESSPKRNSRLSQLNFTNKLSSSLLIKLLSSTFAITLLPPLFFFNSLYYTDGGSLLFTLLTFLFSLNKHHLLASLSGVVAVLFRQTNIVWVFYAASSVVFKIWDEHQEQIQRRSMKSARAKNTPVVKVQPLCSINLLFNRKLLLKLIQNCTPYALVGLGFLVFLIANRGIVLGDKEAHQPRCHFAQLLYFLAFSSFFGFSWIFRIKVIKRFVYLIVRSPLIVILMSSVIIYLILYGRHAHPYLLADNRHITFYIWRRILDRHNSLVPYLLSPLYLFTTISIFYCIKHRSYKENLLFIACITLVTVPNGLLELRYFIIPFVLLRLQVVTTSLEIALELIHYISVNIAMHYLFVNKTFYLPDSSEVQRIMW